MKKILSINDVSKKELLTGEGDSGSDGLLLVSGLHTMLFDFDYIGGYSYSVRVFNSSEWLDKGSFGQVVNQFESKKINEVKRFAKEIMQKGLVS